MVIKSRTGSKYLASNNLNIPTRIGGVNNLKSYLWKQVSLFSRRESIKII